MLTLERLAFLMESMVHRIDSSYFPHSVDLFESGDSKAINVEWDDEDGDGYGISIITVERVGDDGIIHVRDDDGQAYEIEIFERVSKSLVIGQD